MAPNTLRYNFSFKWTNLCDEPKRVQVDRNTIYGILKSDSRFSKIAKIIEQGMIAGYLSKDYGGFTLFVTEDDNIPNSFMQSTDIFTSKSLINSYILDGIATNKYLLSNMSCVYKTLNNDNPILVYIPEGTKDIFVNQVGKILYDIHASNGIIHVMSNMAQVGYVN